MVTDLSVLSDMELARLEQSIDTRAKSMMTEDGKKESQLWTIKLIDYLLNSGYRLPDVDKKRMAIVYADQLSEAIVVYGYTDIEKVVREWVKNDVRQYKAFPTAGDIIDSIKQMLGNPTAEIARRRYEAQVDALVKRERAELLSGATAEHIEELKRRYKVEQG